MTANVLFLKGVDDQSLARVLVDERGQIQLLFSGGVNAESFLRARGVQGAALLFAPVDKRKNLHIERPTLLFNEISDADTHKTALDRARQLREAFPDVACMNEPQRVQASTRDRVAACLAGIEGLIVPKTVRFRPRSPDAVVALWRASFGDEVLVRRAGSHGGARTVRLSGPEDVASLHALPLDGADYYMTELVDYRSADGFYRKHRLAVIGGEPFLRHLIISEDWKIHAASRTYSAQDAHGRQEAAALETFETRLKPAIEARVRQVAERLGLDFFGIDGHVTEQGGLLVFEANANMNLLINPLPAPNMWQAPVERMIDALVRLVEKKSA